MIYKLKITYISSDFVLQYSTFCTSQFYDFHYNILLAFYTPKVFPKEMSTSLADRIEVREYF